MTNPPKADRTGRQIDGLTTQDIFGKGKSAIKVTGASKKPVVPKYRDPSTGQTWTGRGSAPEWIDGSDRTKFAI